MQILNDFQETILKNERKVLNDLKIALVKFSASDQDLAALSDSIMQLDELFLLVVVGEFNAGKSAFINAFLGQRLLKEGVTPTTTQINMIKYGESQDRLVQNEHLHTITLPVDLLHEISIVDTPGTNAIIREHEEITSQFIPRADMVLFITSADRPFTESERVFLSNIRDWGKKVVLVINKVDILQDTGDIEQITSFVAQNAQILLGMTPEVFLVSARKALAAKTGQPSVWLESGFENLEQFIKQTLDEKGRIQLKFLSPLGVGTHLTDKYARIIDSRLGLLQEDFAMLNDIETQLNLFKEDMRRDFQFRMADIDNTLLEMGQRGDVFFDENFRLGRIFDLLSKERIQRTFEQEVVADAPHQIELKVGELIDWMVDANLHQWQAVTEHLGNRRRQHQERIIGDAGGGTFHYDRERLMDAVGREALRVVDTYDKAQEAEDIANGAQAAVAASLAMEAGAIGLGALITVLATTAAADVTGVIAASVVAALGLFIIPARRASAKKQMSMRISELRSQLVSSLRTQFEREMERGMLQINNAIAPYTRFVRGERAKLEETQSALADLDNQLVRLKAQIQDL